MLTAATLGLAGYALYSIVAAAIDLVTRARVEIWADLLGIFFGLLLLLSAAFVRVMMPGGLALAIGALLALQGLSVHSDSHTAVGLTLLPQLVRATFALLLVGLAYVGAREQKQGTPGESSETTEGQRQKDEG
jgi:hypothetical protein